MGLLNTLANEKKGQSATGLAPDFRQIYRENKKLVSEFANAKPLDRSRVLHGQAY